MAVWVSGLTDLLFSDLQELVKDMQLSEACLPGALPNYPEQKILCFCPQKASSLSCTAIQGRKSIREVHGTFGGVTCGLTSQATSVGRRTNGFPEGRSFYASCTIHGA